jgi:hypothetical protein
MPLVMKENRKAMALRFKTQSVIDSEGWLMLFANLRGHLPFIPIHDIQPCQNKQVPGNIAIIRHHHQWAHSFPSSDRKPVTSTLGPP